MATRKLTVSRCTEARRGTSQRTGKEWVMYSVDALDETGAPVPAQLNSFQELPIGELQEYDIEVKRHDHYGESYTLKRKTAQSRALDAIYSRLEKLEGIVNAIERKLA